jgi:hypothetical protein
MVSFLADRPQDTSGRPWLLFNDETGRWRPIGLQAPATRRYLRALAIPSGLAGGEAANPIKHPGHALDEAVMGGPTRWGTSEVATRSSNDPAAITRSAQELTAAIESVGLDPGAVLIRPRGFHLLAGPRPSAPTGDATSTVIVDVLWVLRAAAAEDWATIDELLLELGLEVGLTFVTEAEQWSSAAQDLLDDALEQTRHWRSTQPGRPLPAPRPEPRQPEAQPLGAATAQGTVPELEAPRKRSWWRATAALAVLVGVGAAGATLVSAVTDGSEGARPASRGSETTPIVVGQGEAPSSTRQYTPNSLGYTISLPAREWRIRAERQVNPGLFRTIVKGPRDAQLWLDYAPHEPASFDTDGRTVVDRRELPHPVLGRVVRYVFRGGTAGCKGRICVDYVIGRAAPAYGVLVLGSRLAVSDQVALRAIASLRPYKATLNNREIKPPASVEYLTRVDPATVEADITKVIREHFEFAVAGEYARAWELVSQRYQRRRLQELGSFAAWAKTFNQSGLLGYLRPSGTRVALLDLNPTTGVATVNVTGIQTTQPGASCASWDGVTWAKYEDGRWRYDPGYSTTPARSATWRHRMSELLGGRC